MKKMAIICSHLAHLDPRIEWMADSFAKKYEVTIFSYASSYPLEINQAIEETFFKTESIYKKHHVVHIEPFKVPVRRIITYFYQRCDEVFEKSLGFGLNQFILNTRIKSSNNKLFQRWLYRLCSQNNVLMLCSIPDVRSYIMHFARALYFVEHHSIYKKSVFDKVYCADLDSLILGVLSKIEKDSELIYDAHEIYWDSKNEASHFFKTLMYHYEKVLLPYVDRFITVSQPIESYYLREHQSILNSAVCVPNATPYVENEALVNEPIDSEERNLIVLFQGGICPGRGLDSFIAAWVKVNPQNAHFIIRGPCSEKDKDSLQSLAGDLWGKSIYYEPPVKESELIKAAKDADIGLIPYPPTTLNQKYCSPNKLGQYMQAGCALLVSDTEFVSRIVSDSKAGLIYDSHHIDDIAEKIRLILSDRKQLHQLRAAARDYGRHQFNWGVFEERLLNYVN